MHRIELLLSCVPALMLAVGGCGGDRSESAAAVARAGDVGACDLIGRADAETVIGPLTDEPTARELTLMNAARATSCLYMGESGTLTLRVWQPYRGESTSAALVARLQAERAEQAAEETDPELKAFTANTRISAWDALGTAAALEDMRATIGSVTLHVMQPAAEVYLAVDAATPELAHAAAQRALANLR